MREVGEKSFHNARAEAPAVAKIPSIPIGILSILAVYRIHPAPLLAVYRIHPAPLWRCTAEILSIPIGILGILKSQ